MFYKNCMYICARTCAVDMFSIGSSHLKYYFAKEAVAVENSSFILDANGHQAQVFMNIISYMNKCSKIVVM